MKAKLVVLIGVVGFLLVACGGGLTGGVEKPVGPVAVTKVLPTSTPIVPTATQMPIVEPTPTRSRLLTLSTSNPTPTPRLLTLSTPEKTPTARRGGYTVNTQAGDRRPSFCPSDGEMQRLFGFDKIGVKPVYTGSWVDADGELSIPWEPCKWTLQAVGIGAVEFPFLKDWQFTFTDLDGNVWVSYGDGRSWAVQGATFRYLPAYRKVSTADWVLNDQVLFSEEWDFGANSSPDYTTCPGNVDVVLNAEQVRACEAGGQSSALVSNCPTTPQQASELIGGPAQYWLAPTWEGGAWVFRHKEHWYELRWPGFGSLEVWIDGAVEVTAENADVLNGRQFDEASFQCDTT